MSNALAGILSVLFFIPFVAVYADNPTPYDEWDFHFIIRLDYFVECSTIHYHIDR